MDAKTAMIVAPKTVLNKSSPIGDHDVAGTQDEAVTISSEKNEAKIPAVTI